MKDAPLGVKEDYIIIKKENHSKAYLKFEVFMLLRTTYLIT